MIHFEGDKSFPLPVAEVAARLSDAGFLANCLPDAQVSEATPDKAVWKLKPKLSFLTGSLNVEMNSTGREAGKSVAYKVFAKAIGASSTVVTLTDLRRGAGRRNRGPLDRRPDRGHRLAQDGAEGTASGCGAEGDRGCVGGGRRRN